MTDESTRPGNEPVHEELVVSKEEDSGSFRRFSDKMLYSAVSVVMLLTGTVWALTWFNTDSKVVGLSTRASVIESIQQKHSDQLIRLQVTQEYSTQHLQSINNKQSVLEGQVQGVQQSLNQVLLELRKAK